MSIESDKLMNLADGKVLYDDLRERAESVVEVSSTEPTSENNKIWIDNTGSGTGVQIPTYTEFTDVLSTITQTNDNIAPQYEDLTFPVLKYSACIHNDELYYAPNAIQTSEAWDASHWVKATVGVRLLDVRTSIDSIVSALGYFYVKPQGGIPASDLASGIVTAVDNVSGTTPSITGIANTRYICGEVATLTITPPQTGDIEVVFDSGSTATVLTVPSTVRFPEWFDSTDLESNRTYDIIISNGELGLVTSWA